jgi:hypothetical protein
MGFHGEGLVQDKVLAGNVKVKLEQVIYGIIDQYETAGFQINLHRMAGIHDMEWGLRIVEPETLTHRSIRALNMNG